MGWEAGALRRLLLPPSPAQPTGSQSSSSSCLPAHRIQASAPVLLPELPSLGSVIQADQPPPLAWSFQFQNWETPGQTGAVAYTTSGFLLAKFKDTSQSLTILTSSLLQTPCSSLILSLLSWLQADTFFSSFVSCFLCPFGPADWVLQTCDVLGTRDLETKGAASGRRKAQ